MTRSSVHVLQGRLGAEYPVMTRGQGVYVFDKAGKRYLDAIGGVGVVNIGHAVPEVVEAIAGQALSHRACRPDGDLPVAL